MSVSTEVQRTLVKSPPELWAELSNPDALTRHLGELGDIRITSVEPETKVEWEADEASGIVELKQSSWGTKVTLSVTRNAPVQTEQPEPEPAIVAAPEPTAANITPEPEAKQTKAVEPESEPVATVEPEPEPVATVEPEPEPDPEPVAMEPEPRLGFFARLFRKRKAKPMPVVETEPELEPEIEVVALAAPEPIYPEPVVPEPEVVAIADDLATELASVETQMTQETTELLTGVLDRLGAAHHRPFSRG
jgi:hypothetical protein